MCGRLLAMTECCGRKALKPGKYKLSVWALKRFDEPTRRMAGKMALQIIFAVKQHGEISLVALTWLAGYMWAETAAVALRRKQCLQPAYFPLSLFLYRWIREFTSSSEIRQIARFYTRKTTTICANASVKAFLFTCSILLLLLRREKDRMHTCVEQLSMKIQEPRDEEKD